jgi:HAE1 family hydrophobic/amphiphilic exporter-1
VAFLQQLMTLLELQDASTDPQLSNPEIRIDLRRAEAAVLGLSPSQVLSTLQSAYGGRKLTNILAATDQYPVIMEVDQRYQADINALGSLFLSGSAGMVPLSAVADISRDVGPVAINHYGSLPAVTLSFNLAPSVALGEATQAVNAAAASHLGSLGSLGGSGGQVSSHFAGSA